MRQRRLLTVGHSYVVTLNRRLPHEMSLVGRGEWDVTVVAPKSMTGDLRPIHVAISPEEPCCVEAVNVYFARRIHAMLYGRRTKSILSAHWDMVHIWEEPYIVAGFQLARWLPRGVPFTFWTMQNIAKQYPPPFPWLERAVVRRCTGWIAVGQTTAEMQLQRGQGYESRPHRTLPLGVDTEAFRADPAARAAILRELNWSDSGPPVVGFLGRFVPAKGLETLLRALETLQTPWRALFIGTGPMEARLREWAKSREDRVRILTHVAHDAVPAYLNAMDLLAAPSQTTPHWREQFGRMLIEAMASGVPVLGSDSGEIPHVIADAGRIVPEADRPAWTTALGELLDNAHLRRELAERGQVRVRELFAWPVVARKHLDFFDELLESRPLNEE